MGNEKLEIRITPKDLAENPDIVDGLTNYGHKIFINVKPTVSRSNTIVESNNKDFENEVSESVNKELNKDSQSRNYERPWNKNENEEKEIKPDTKRKLGDLAKEFGKIGIIAHIKEIAALSAEAIKNLF